MSHFNAIFGAESPFSYAKLQSGQQIEEARKRQHITQLQLARDLGLGVRWLREIEAGNPKSRLEDHLRCAYRLGLSTGHILIPLLFAGQNMHFPRQLATGDLTDLERMCIEMIAQCKLDHLRKALTPAWHPHQLALGSAG